MCMLELTNNIHHILRLLLIQGISLIRKILIFYGTLSFISNCIMTYGLIKNSFHTYERIVNLLYLIESKLDSLSSDCWSLWQSIAIGTRTYVHLLSCLYS